MGMLEGETKLAIKYYYQCPNCEHESEEWHMMDDTPEIKCPECGTIKKKIIKLCNMIIQKPFDIEDV